MCTCVSTSPGKIAAEPKSWTFSANRHAIGRRHLDDLFAVDNDRSRPLTFRRHDPSRNVCLQSHVLNLAVILSGVSRRFSVSSRRSRLGIRSRKSLPAVPASTSYQSTELRLIHRNPCYNPRMQTLAAQTDQHEICERLSRVTPDSPRLWGRMNAHQMICHLADSFRVVLGEQTAAAGENTASRAKS